MKRLVLEPDGWPRTLRECPPGLFVHDDEVGFKTEYGAMEAVGPTNVPGPEVRWTVGNHADAYCDTGEFFCAGDKEKRDQIVVQPVVARWAEEEV
jgi:hypothetical protein